MIDMGNPFLNLTVDGFLKIGTVTSLHFRHFFPVFSQNSIMESFLLVSVIFPFLSLRWQLPEPQPRKLTTSSKEVISTLDLICLS